MSQNKNLEDFLLDKQRVRSSFDLAANRYDEVAVLQREIGRRMAERLDLVRITPQQILDAGAGTGSLSRSLSQRYPQAHVIALDISHAMLRRAYRVTSARSMWRRLPYIGKKFSKQLFACGDIEHLPLTADAVDLIFSNLTLQWCNDLEQVFVVVHGFRSRDFALGYIELLKNNKDYRIDNENFVILSANYKVVQIHKNIEAYRSLIHTPKP